MYDSLRGHFLLATRHLHDSNFFRSAVLLLEHNTEGAMGLIVNRPSSVNVAHGLAGHFDVTNCNEVIYLGGPVEPSAFIMLHNNAEWGNTELEILPGVFVGNSAEAFESVVMDTQEPGSSTIYRIYSGYAGWGEGQLEHELARGDWFSLEASADHVFHPQPIEVWDSLLSEFHKQHRILPIPSDRAEWN